eukprot:547114_1
MSSLRILNLIKKCRITNRYKLLPSVSLLRRLHYNSHHKHISCIRPLHHIRYNSSNNKTPNKNISFLRNNKQNTSNNTNKQNIPLMPEFRHIRQWDKFEWIFSCANMFQFIGFLSYDYTFLRILSLLSASGLMVAHTGRKFFVGWFWACSFAVANIVALYFILREKYSLDLRGLNEEELAIYHTYFEPFIISPLEYKHILSIGKFITMNRGETLTVSGLICDKVFLILYGQCVVLNNDDQPQTIGIISGGHQRSFVGEIALIDDTQDAATATVKTNSEKTRLLYWDVNRLKYLLTHCQSELRVKLINVFTTSMKIKLMDFNANFNVEKSIEFKQKTLETIIQMLLICKCKLKITESEKVDCCQFLMEENEIIELSVDERMFLNEYIKLKQISDGFAKSLMKKYHINF